VYVYVYVLHSRFGKYLELAFNKDRELLGAMVRTYMLESNLVCHHAGAGGDGSNFHVFYYMLFGTNC
jgi:myosin heavy subunit